MSKTPTKAWQVTIATTGTDGVTTTTVTRANSQKEVDRILKDARDNHLVKLLLLSGLPTMKHLEMALSPHPNYDTRRRHGKILDSIKWNRVFPRTTLKVSVQPC